MAAAGRVGISLEALHWVFWEHCDQRTREITIELAELGANLAVSKARAGHAITGLREAGRIEKVEGERSTYKVADPAAFVPDGDGENDS